MLKEAAIISKKTQNPTFSLTKKPWKRWKISQVNLA